MTDPAWRNEAWAPAPGQVAGRPAPGAAAYPGGPVQPAQPVQPYGPLQWAPPRQTTKLLGDLSTVYVVVADSRWIHTMVCSIGRDWFGATYNFGSQNYKLKRRHSISMDIGGKLENAFDPTNGLAKPYGCFTVSWRLTPRGYTVVRARVDSLGIVSSYSLNHEAFPRFAYMLFQEFYGNRTLVWVGELRDPWDSDILKWPAAPVSPTPRPPDDASEKAVWDAVAAGWEIPKF
ncbi:hypothetical protein ET495_01595 [Xylanimonas allomyrinae]|uniref:Uncharacterized protein n=1 Tax=Xylanimonas allomyrinae TaxID=2509459 RepID=A0A4P6EKL3_9MICO|nr:hypothetical protein [Xylanimonas allomyrinae]QAY62183.1 hypothetical protein ET495_01595 [Xylanimonas allomyrinae]